ncbi:MAG: tryptophan-rich sensory protein [Acidobacteriota bacterium]|jgi:tryptophan-rich sensory protein
MGNVGKLGICLAVPVLVGALSGLATARGLEIWYPSLTKPSFNPPDWVFGPVWTVLYLMMGLAAWLIWRGGLSRPGVRAALAAFGVQLALNGLWSVLFFGMRAPGLAFAEILALWLAIGATVWLFARVSAPAAAWMLPYWAWVSFASVLNFALWRLNP